MFNPFNPEFNIVIFIHNKSRIATDDLRWFLKLKKIATY